MKTVLDNVMKERTAMNIGVKKRKAQVISYKYEEEMWSKGVLGEDCPDRLRDTVLFLIGNHCTLRASDKHYYLHRPTPTEKSQLTFEFNGEGTKCLVYREDTISKTHDGGLKDMRTDRKEVWVYPSAIPERCCVRLVEKYMKLCPPYYKKSNFYLQSLPKPTPSQSYGEQVVGQQTLSKTVKRLFEEAKIEGFFMNHSCRRSGTTRLFQAGVPKKLIKEVTGHRSDAVDNYAETSDVQCEMISNIIDGNATSTVSRPPPVCETKQVPKVENIVKTCTCGATSDINTKNIGFVVDNIMSKLDQTGKTTIKLQIEITKE